MKSGKKSSKRGGKGRKVLYTFISLLGVAVIIMSCAYGAFVHYYSKMNIISDGEQDFEYVSDAEIRQGEDIDTETMSEADLKKLEEIGQSYTPGEIDYDYNSADVTNIIILGTDSRKKGRYRTNSDAMVLVSINKTTKKIFISSFLRDILVDVPKGGNHKQAGKSKLNSAYGYGGSKLMFQTYQKNFGIKIDKFVHMDFFNFVNIVNSLGGLDMYLRADEIKVMNEVYIFEMNKLYGTSHRLDWLPEKSGNYHLNGKQALAYTRVRYVGGDFQRTERQRKVIEEVLKKVKKMSAKKLNSFVERCLHYVTTNLDQTEIMSIIVSTPEYLDYDRVNVRIPIDKTYHSSKLQGAYVLVVDLQKNADYWYSLVYQDKDISEDIYLKIKEEKKHGV